MRYCREIKRTDTEIDVDDDGTVYWTDTEISVTDDSETGVHLSVKETYRDTGGYVAQRGVSMSGEDFIELVKAEAEAEAKESLRWLTGVG
jgi:hypothetical protein